MGTTIKGIALEPHTESRGTSGLERTYSDEDLKDATETLNGKPVVSNAEWDDPEKVIGEVTDVEYEEGEGVRFEAHIEDEEAAERIREELAEVAPRFLVEVNDEDDEVSTNVRSFDGLFTCPETAEGVPGVTEILEDE